MSFSAQHSRSPNPLKSSRGTAPRPNGALVLKLKSAAHEWHSLTELAGGLRLSRSELREAIEGLESLGYELEYHPGLGVRLASSADLLTPEEIVHGLRSRLLGSQVIVQPVAGSTNDEAAARAMAGCAEGLAVFAEKQTHGRGRLGRTWASPYARGLWFSVVLRPHLAHSAASILTLLGAVAGAEAIRSELGTPALIRWPNDLVIRGRKVGGVLVEVRADGRRGRACILGIGINANYPLDEMPLHIRRHATSLLIEHRAPVDRVALARSLLWRLDRWYLQVKRGQMDALAEAWRALSATLGRRALVEQHGRQFRGTVLDIDPQGSLVMQLRGGATRHFRAHEVTRVVEEGDPD